MEVKIYVAFRVYGYISQCTQVNDWSIYMILVVVVMGTVSYPLPKFVRFYCDKVNASSVRKCRPDSFGAL